MRYRSISCRWEVTSPIFTFIWKGAQEALDKLIDLMKKHKPVLVEVDMLQKFLRLEKIESYSEANLKMEPVVDVARKMRCHILFTHHAPKLEREIVDSGLGSTGLVGMSIPSFSSKEKDRTEINFPHYNGIT